jgi:hypothetical protein
LIVFSQQRLREWEWDLPFAGESSKPTMVGFGRKQETIKVRFFGFHYRATHEANVCFLTQSGHERRSEPYPQSGTFQRAWLDGPGYSILASVGKLRRHAGPERIASNP